MTNQMRYIQLSSFGHATNLKMEEKEIPQPKAGEILIQVEAIGVNYSDILRRTNTYFMPTPLPYTLGSEAVGKIVKLGEGVNTSHFEIGKRVLAILPFGGGYAEQVLANEQYCIPLPPPIQPKDATAIFVQGSTAHLMIHQLARDVNGKTLLIHAAAGGVGSLLIQLSKLAGSKVIGTASTSEKLEKVKACGADITIDYSKKDWVEDLLNQNNNEKVDYIFEMVGGTIYQNSFKCLKQGGSMIVYGQAGKEKGYMHSEHFVDESHNLLSFNLAHFIQNRTKDWQTSLRKMIELLATRQITIQTTNTYALKDAAIAHKDIENRKTSGKVVLIP